MDLVILAPSPVPLAMGGAENLWLGLQRHINEETSHNCELIKFPAPGADLEELLGSYLEPGRIELKHFDAVLTGKDPAWFIEHPDHRLYMLHKLRGLYDTYHFFREPEVEEPVSPVARRVLDDVAQLRRTEAGPSQVRHIVEDLLTSIRCGELDERDLRFPGPFARQLVHGLDDCALSPRRISRYAAISETVAKRAGYFPPDVDVAVAYPPPRLQGFKCSKPEHFFTVSRLDSSKRIDLIIREFREVRGDVNLFIAGTGPAQDELKQAAAGDDRIVFLGKLTDAEMIDYYARSIAVPFTPYDEDYGLITVEAMNSGKPVLTVQDSGGVAELVQNGVTGWCVPNEKGALAAAFKDALKNSSRTAEMGKAAKKSVKHISWENVASTLLGDPPASVKIIASGPAPRSEAKKGKIVVASTFGIYPPRGGGQSRIFHLYSKIAEDYDVTAVCLVGSQEEFRDSVIAPGFREIRIPKSAEHEEAEADRSRQVDWVPITDIVCCELLHLTPRFGEVLAEQAAEAQAVVASGPYLIDAIVEHMPDVPLLYEAHNLEVELKRDILPSSPAGEELLDTVARMEGTCWTRSELVFACAARDLRSLDGIYGSTRAVTIEIANGFAPSETRFTEPSERRELGRALHPAMSKSAIFLGSWHGPNLTAVETILKIAPLFEDVRFLLVGSACLAFKDRTFPANVIPFGTVDEDEKALLLASASVALNPMTEGSGSNLKMLDYFGAGIPVISTLFGARGLDAQPGTHFIKAEEDELTLALSDFFAQGGAGSDMVGRAYRLAIDNYSWDVIGSKLLDQLDTLSAKWKVQ